MKVVSESRATWDTSVPILVFLGLSVLDLGAMYATDRRQTEVRRASSLNAPYARGGGIVINTEVNVRTTVVIFLGRYALTMLLMGVLPTDEDPGSSSCSTDDLRDMSVTPEDVVEESGPPPAAIIIIDEDDGSSSAAAVVAACL